jgi:hypothetical protein
MVLPLRIWGKDTLGRPFVQLAHTLDVSASGARVAGFRTAVRVGEVIAVQYRHYKADFRVAWVGERGTARHEQIGIEYLEKGQRILGLDMRDEGFIDDYEPPLQEASSLYETHRSHPRHSVTGSAEVRIAHSRTGYWGSLVDLSLGGCYIQTPSPLPVNTRTRLLLKLAGEEIQMWGAVRTCHRDVGMGIEFTDALTESDADLLKLLVKRLEAGEDLAPAAMPKLTPDKLAERLRAAVAELTLLEDALKELNVPAEVLRHYRGSLGHLRTSAWALQRWFELEEFGLDSSPVFSFLKADRVQSAVQACQVLSAQFHSPVGKLEPQESIELLRAVENLFAHLTGFSMSEEVGSVTANSAASLPAESELGETDGIKPAQSYSAGTRLEADAVRNPDIESEPAYEKKLAAAAAADESAEIQTSDREATATPERVVKKPFNKKRSRWKVV